MSNASDEAQRRYEADAANWTTATCVHCGEKFKALRKDVPATEPHYCPECRTKLFGRD